MKVNEILTERVSPNIKQFARIIAGLDDDHLKRLFHAYREAIGTNKKAAPKQKADPQQADRGGAGPVSAAGE